MGLSRVKVQSASEVFLIGGFYIIYNQFGHDHVNIKLGGFMAGEMDTTMWST